MSKQSNDYLPLENYLKSVSGKRTAFPERNTDYFRRYLGIKDWISQNFLRNTGAGLSAQDHNLYTQHDLGHIEDVIQSAGLLLGLGHDPALISKLNPYEVYVLLVATLLHDAGNAYGRSSHEKRPFEILTKMGDVAGANSVEKRTIAEVAKAHGGRTTTGSKDTIGTVITQEQAMIQHATFRGRALAGILRFADEISEGPSRANYVATTEPELSPSSEIYNVYCKHVNVAVDIRDKAIVVDYEIPASILCRQFPTEDTTRQYFIDYIADRLSKCNTERIYCNRFMAEIVWFDKIRVGLRIVRDDTILEQISIVIKEEGYPAASKPMKEYNPKFDGKTLHALHGSDKEGHANA